MDFSLAMAVAKGNGSWRPGVSISKRRAMLAGTAVATLCAWTFTLEPATAAEQRQASPVRLQQQLAASDTLLNLAIPAQSLAAALNSFSEQAGISFAYKTGDISALRSPGVTGEMTTAAGLQQLLSGTGISFEFTASNTVVLMKTADGSSNAELLDTIQVEGASSIGDHTGAADRASSIYIERDDLERRNPQSVKQVFAGESSVSVGGAVRTSQKVYVNGIEETNLAVTINGARQNNKIFHHSGNNLIEPSLLKGVRVDPGVAPADAGPGALGGAIAYETVDVDDILPPDRSVGGFATGSFDTNSGTFINGTSGYGRTGGFEALGYFKWGLGGEYENGDGETVPGSETDLRSFLGKGGYETDDGHRFEFSAEHLRDRAARPYRANIGNLTNRSEPATRAYDTERQNLVFNYNKPNADGLWDPTAVLGYGVTELRVPDPFGSEGETSSLSGKFENAFNFDGFGFSDSITLGTDFYHDRAKYDDPTTKVSERATNAGVYAQARLQPVETLRVSFGLRGDHQWFEGVDGSEINDAGLSGNVSGAYDVTEFLTLNAGYSRVWGGIALAENFILNPNWSYDDDIKPVRSENFTAGFEVFHDGFSFDAGVFRSEFDNARDPSFGAGPSVTSDFTTRGFNLGAGYNWDAGFVRVSYTDSQIDVDGSAADSDITQYFGAPLGRVIALEALHSFENTGVTIGGTIDAALENDDTADAGGEKLDSYEVLGVFAEYRPEFAEYLTLRVEANNILDENYADRATYGQDFSVVEPLREAGRSFLFLVRAEF